MTAFAYLRNPASLLAAVSLSILFVWFVLGYPARMPPSPLSTDEKLPCVAYAPVPLQPDSESHEIPVEQIETDLVRLTGIAACVRTYTTGMGLERVPELAGKLGLKVLQGVALGPDLRRNRDEIERALRIAESQRPAIRALVVGSGVLSRGDMRTNELAAQIRAVRDAAKLPVTYADRAERWLDADGVAGAVDFITVHLDLYTGRFPAAAGDAAHRMIETRDKITAAYPNRMVLIDGVGWPSAGRMREAAFPSPANQARVLHEVLRAAKSANIHLTLFEGLDQPWRQEDAGTAAGHWGLIDAESGAPKFQWGAAVSNHPLWFTQGMLGVLLALVVFAAAYLSARSAGPSPIARTDWLPIAAIAAGAGLVIGWAFADIPVQNRQIADWLYAGVLLALGLIVPPIAAAASARRIPLVGFSAALDPAKRAAMTTLELGLALLFAIVAVVAIQIALVFVFDPESRDFPFAALTGPVVAFLTLAMQPQKNRRNEGMAERLAAWLLAIAAVFIAFNETFWNWQALWLAAVLLALAWSCWQVRGAQTT